MPQKTEDLPMKLVMFNNHLVEFLVGGLEHGFYFPCHIWDIILPIDELIFFKMATLHHQPDKLNMLTRHILTQKGSPIVGKPKRQDLRQASQVLLGSDNWSYISLPRV